MTPFTWRNCYADIHAGFHSRTIAAYLRDVVEPAIAALDQGIEELARSEEAWAPFAKADTELLRGETMKAFALAIQSLWERQFREYVCGCATELKLGDAIIADARAVQWQRVEFAFFKARGIRLADFPSYSTLSALHLLGNVCRHGEGPSVAKLHALQPDLWLSAPSLPIGGVTAPPPPLPSAGLIRITLERLRAFAAAITDFWLDANYIYLESITAKHENVVADLARLRASRAWLPQACPMPNTKAER